MPERDALSALLNRINRKSENHLGMPLLSTWDAADMIIASDWLAARDRENRAIGWDEGWVNRASRSLFGPVSVPEPPRGLNPYRGDNQ